MKKDKRNKLIIGSIVVILLVVGIFLSMPDLFDVSGDKTMSVKYYDANKNPISPTFSVVSGTPDVAYISFTIKIKNTGNVALTSNILSAEPVALSNALQNQPIRTIAPDQTATWTSGLVETKQFENSTKTFKVIVKNEYFAGNEKRSFNKEASLSLTILSDPIVGAELNIESSSGSSGTGADNTTTRLSTGSTCNANTDCASGSCVSKQIDSWTFDNSIGGVLHEYNCMTEKCRLVRTQSSSCTYKLTTLEGISDKSMNNEGETSIIYNGNKMSDVNCQTGVINVYKLEQISQKECA